MNDDFRLEPPEPAAPCARQVTRRKNRRAARTVGDYVEMFLRRNKPHADGTPGNYFLRVAVIERADMCARRVSIGLDACNRKDAVRAAVLVLRVLVAVHRMRLTDSFLMLVGNTDLPLWVPLESVNLPRKKGQKKR